VGSDSTVVSTEEIAAANAAGEGTGGGGGGSAEAAVWAATADSKDPRVRFYVSMTLRHRWPVTWSDIIIDRIAKGGYEVSQQKLDNMVRRGRGGERERRSGVEEEREKKTKKEKPEKKPENEGQKKLTFFPPLLLLQFTPTLNPQVAFLTTAGISDQDVCYMAAVAPGMLSRSAKRHGLPLYNYLKQRVKGKGARAAVLREYPRLLEYDVVGEGDSAVLVRGNARASVDVVKGNVGVSFWRDGAVFDSAPVSPMVPTPERKR